MNCPYCQEYMAGQAPRLFCQSCGIEMRRTSQGSAYFSSYAFCAIISTTFGILATFSKGYFHSICLFFVGLPILTILIMSLHLGRTKK